MKLKVIESPMSLGYSVVRAEYGEQRTMENGVKYTYEPIALCRVPEGYGRTKEEAKALAEKIARLLDFSDDVRSASSAPIIPDDEVMELTENPPAPRTEDDIPW